jgi:hypothetical protein
MKGVVLHLSGECVFHWRNHPIGDAVAAGTMQSLGMDEIEEEVIEGVLIHKQLGRKVHGAVSSDTQGHLY